ncbi:glutaredoxin-like protein [Ceratobasidium sp. AG-I]|nr:glutaredoxin-like protein [Ceratobasidium sp. AG-I]
MFRAGLRSVGRKIAPIRQLRQPIPPSRIAVRLLSDQVRQTIDNAVKSTPLVLFMKGTPETPQCGFSRAVIQILDLHDVPKDKMKTYNVLEDAELRNSIKEYSDWPTIPQLYVDGQFVGGCDIVMSMHQSGELEDLFEKSKIIPPIPPKAE